MEKKSLMDEYVDDVKKYMNKRFTHDFVQDDLLSICAGIEKVLLMWTGDTYIGRKKDEKHEGFYQKFFVVINEFLMFCCKHSEELSDMERDLAEKMLYRGIVYRYLGTCDHRNYRKKIVVEPEYNDIFVSWSKTETNSYIENKLYGPITWMKAEIKSPHYGIDIHGYELWCQEWLGESSFITRGLEKEVVFPTIEASIVEIRHKGFGS